MRRGIAELNGEGEVVGAIVVMRWGENALDTIKAVKLKLDQLKNGLPDGVEIVETYDRSILIERAVKNLGGKLAKEFLIVALVCIVFYSTYARHLLPLSFYPLVYLLHLLSCKNKE